MAGLDDMAEADGALLDLRRRPGAGGGERRDDNKTAKLHGTVSSRVVEAMRMRAQATSPGVAEYDTV
jgi:hypothetical protein